MSKPQQDYNADSIQVLEGLEPVKQRPGMYTRLESPNHMVYEVIDNAQDEALANFANVIEVTAHPDGSVEVFDNGRGIPTGAVAKAGGKSAAEVIFTKLHAGGKFNKNAEGSAYKFSGGLHGVGVSVTNALSKRLEVNIYREGEQFFLAFENGFVVEPLRKVGKIDKQLRGTRVRAWPDGSYFDHPDVNLHDLEHYLRCKAVLLKGVKISLKTPKHEEPILWNYPEGLSQYLQEQTGTEAEWVAPLFSLENFIQTPTEHFVAGEGSELALGWLAQGRTFSESYVNLIPTIGGGKHENGLRSAVFEAVKGFMEQHALIPKGLKIETDDVWARTCFVLSLKMLDPVFQGQTKDKLGSEIAVRLVNQTVKDPLLLWLNEHVSEAKMIAELVIDAATTRSKTGVKIERKKTAGGAVLPGKLSDCESDNPQRNELFLVEGDSAGGSAKMGRSKEIQAILPLRGKLLNTWDADAQRLYQSGTVSDISLAIGVEPHGHFEDFNEADISKLRYHKILILSDADVDGSHIQVLLLTLFFRHFPKLISSGHIFIAQSPLYRLDAPPKRGQKGERKFYALDDSELKAIQDRLIREGVNMEKTKIARFKGLGEMNPDQLWETTMNPDTRRTLQVGFSENTRAQTIEMFDLLMNDKNPGKRRAWMEEFGDTVEADI